MINIIPHREKKIKRSKHSNSILDSSRIFLHKIFDKVSLISI